MDLVIFEENKPLVLQALKNGEFDYIEACSEEVETDFFRYIYERHILQKLAKNYPTPRKKEEVPREMYLSGNFSLRMHGEHAFHKFPAVVRMGGMVNALGPMMGKKVVHPDTGDITLACKGFNKKNHYDRQTPCDQDYLRKLSRDTDPNALVQWHNSDVVKVFRGQRIFDQEGIFIGDASYLFVPDNPKYEGSARLLFDESNHPMSQEAYKNRSDEEKVRCRWRRCYKIVTLLHTNRNLDFFIFVGVKVMSGNVHECPVLYEMVEQFVQAMGKGVMRRLILDRGFLDGESISTCKQKHKIDVLIPVRRNMDVYKDAEALFQQSEVHWNILEAPKTERKEPSRPRPEVIERREKKRQETLKQRTEKESPAPPEEILVKTFVAAIGGFRSWSSCTVPLTVVANREHYADGHQETWYLLDTRKVWAPKRSREEYALRTSIEERYRQIKCFSDLTNFTSRTFSLVVNQVVFVVLAYSLLQLYLLKNGRKDLTKKTPPGIMQQLLPSANHIIVSWQNFYGLFSPMEFAELLTLELGNLARKKVGEKCRRLRRELTDGFKNPRAL